MRPNRRFVLAGILTLLLVSLPSFATNNPYLFEVKKDEHVSWLFGTSHHSIAYSDVQSNLQPVIDQARVAFSEWVLSEERAHLWLTSPEQAIVTETGFEPKGEPLNQHTKMLLAKKFGVKEPLLSRLHKNNCDELRRYLASQHFPFLDLEIQNYVLEKGIELRALDTKPLLKQATEADKNFCSPFVPCDLEHLVESTSLEELIKASEDELYKEGRFKPGEFYDPRCGVGLRNRAWMETLIPEVNKGRVFVFVGAGHIYGEAGLIQLLEREGFEVQRVTQQ